MDRMDKTYNVIVVWGKLRFCMWIAMVTLCCTMILCYMLYSSYQFYGTDIAKSQMTEPVGVTSYQYSTFFIIDSQRKYKICDQLDIIIEARDAKMRPKVNGGDYFRVRIYNNDLKAGASPDGDVVHIGDGKYKASFTLRWVGKTFVRVILVHSAEAVDVLRRARDTMSSRYGYFGRFSATIGKKLIKEDTLCNITPPMSCTAVCDLTRHKIEAPWFCTVPSSTKLNCSNFSWTCANKKYSSTLKAASMTKAEQNLFKRQKQPIPVEGISYVTVTEQEKDVMCLTHCCQKKLPLCRVGSYNLSNPMAAGYFYKGEWYSNYCQVRNFHVDEALKCLANKTLYLHGDSTCRQYYEYLVKTLSKTLKPNPPTKQSNWKVGPSLAVDKKNNFTVRYRHHGHPIRNKWTDASQVQYIEEALDELAGGPDTIYMFTIWAHLTTINMSFYENRVRRIRAAVERLHKRSPETLVVIKSANTRLHDSAGRSVTASDWLARALDNKLREVFRSYDHRIGFIDQWSMAVGFSNTDDVHPGKGVISSGIRTLLSYICPT